MQRPPRSRCDGTGFLRDPNQEAPSYPDGVQKLLVRDVRGEQRLAKQRDDEVEPVVVHFVGLPVEARCIAFAAQDQPDQVLIVDDLGSWPLSLNIMSEYRL